MTVKNIEEEIDFPSFAICSDPPFRDVNKEMLTLAAYENNTFDPKDFILHVGWYRNDEMGNHKDVVFDHLFEMEELLTYFFGRCLVFHLKFQVKRLPVVKFTTMLLDH